MFSHRRRVSVNRGSTVYFAENIVESFAGEVESAVDEVDEVDKYGNLFFFFVQ